MKRLCSIKGFFYFIEAFKNSFFYLFSFRLLYPENDALLTAKKKRVKHGGGEESASEK